MRPLETDPELPSDAELTRDSENGTVRLLKGNNLGKYLTNDENYNKALSEESPEQIAIAFISAYSRQFRLRNPREELIVSAVQTDDLGMAHVRLIQQYRKLSVWPADLNVHMNASKQVYLVQGRYVPTPINLSVTPGLSEAEVLSTVVRDLGVAVSEVNKHRVELIVYCGTMKSVKLAYRLYIEVSLAEAWSYVIDAQTGTVIEKSSANQVQNSSKGKLIFK